MTYIDSFNLGVAAEFLAASIFIELGYEVFLPFNRRGKADLIILKDKIFSKIQVKRANWVQPKHTTSKYLRVMTSSHGVNYSKEDIDYFAFVDDIHRMWLVPMEIIKDNKIITLDKKTTSKRNWTTNARFKSEDYLITKYPNS